jgi:hypothetical protein
MYQISYGKVKQNNRAVMTALFLLRVSESQWPWHELGVMPLTGSGCVLHIFTVKMYPL